jgi:hypothetical protein
MTHPFSHPLLSVGLKNPSTLISHTRHACWSFVGPAITDRSYLVNRNIHAPSILSLGAPHNKSLDKSTNRDPQSIF